MAGTRARVLRPSWGPLDGRRLTQFWFRPLLAQAGRPRSVRFHDLRHSYASIALAQGVHPKVAQEALGHSTIAVTMDLYSHVVPTLQRDAARTMGAAPVRIARETMKTVAEVERRWIAYARGVVHVSPSHLALCESKGGVPDAADPSRSLRWPGYIGRRYDEGRGILCVNQVHRDDNAESEQVDLGVNLRYVDATARWKAGDLDDGTFLEETRRAYEYWIPRWDAWKHFRQLVQEQLGLGVDEIAYTNLAKCQLPIDRDTTPVVQLCQQEFPMGALVTAIRPLAVLCARADAYEGGPIVREWCSTEVFTFNFRTGQNKAGELRSVWGAKMAARLRVTSSEL
ncbi:MAG: tyrosine-type recombinase/integrase [Thermoleophilaceae bacterium]